MPPISEHEEPLEDQPSFWLDAPAGDGRAPVVWLHDAPSSAEDWRPFLELTGGIAPDLPGFGRSGKRGDQAFDLPFYAHWLDAFLDARGIDRMRLVVHGWSAACLAAESVPGRLERLVVIAGAPLPGGPPPGGLARLWRAPGVGEVAVGLLTPASLRLISRRWNAQPMPDAWRATVMRFFDQGTQRALLRLHRSATAEALAQAGGQLARLDCPALVVWGDREPFFGAADATGAGYARVLPDAGLRVIEDAGHWPWLDRPELVADVAAFLAAGS